MTFDKAHYERILKRCQVGLIGRSPAVVDEANNLLAECYGGIGALLAEVEQLESGVANPETVFLNMKAGAIARPSLRNMIDLYGEVLNGEEAQLLEIAKLRAELAGLRTGYDAQNNVIAGLKEEGVSLRKALGDLLALYEDDEGCRSLPEYIAGRAAMAKEASHG